MVGKIKARVVLFLTLLLLICLIFTGISQNQRDISPVPTFSQKSFTIGHIAYASVGVLDYTCDGVDDNVQFQLALNALPVGGGKIVVLSGNYDFSATVLRAIDNIVIEGTGRGSYFANDGSTALFSAGAQSYWVFRDLRTDAGGVTVSGASYWTLDNVYLGGTYSALRIDDASIIAGLANGEWFTDYASLETFTAGENITAGQIVYKAADGDVNLADATDNTTMRAIAVALETIEDTNTGLFMVEGWYRNTGWSETPGVEVYASATPGTITVTPLSVTGDQVQVIGEHRTADIVYLYFDSTVVEVP